MKNNNIRVVAIVSTVLLASCNSPVKISEADTVQASQALIPRTSVTEVVLVRDSGPRDVDVAAGDDYDAVLDSEELVLVCRLFPLSPTLSPHAGEGDFHWSRTDLSQQRLTR
jgi:hypothetical protein